MKNYIQTDCPGTAPRYVVIAESPNRLSALLANRIDASPLELIDGVTLESKAGDRDHLLASFSHNLPQLHTTSVFVNGDFAKRNPGTVEAVVKALLEQHRKVAGNPDYLKQITQKYVPKGIDPSTLDAAVKKYVELRMFDVNGGLTQANLQFTVQFFGPSGTKATDKAIPVSELADLSFLNQALTQLKPQ